MTGGAGSSAGAGGAAAGAVGQAGATPWQPCDDDNPCTADALDPSGQCTSSPLADSTSCDDRDACTGGDRCLAATCVGEPRTSSPEVLSTLVSYAPESWPTIAALLSEERVIYASRDTYTLARREGERLVVLDRLRSPLHVLYDNVSPMIWLHVPQTFVVPVSEQQIAIVSLSAYSFAVDVYDISGDRFVLTARHAQDSFQAPSAAVGQDGKLWVCSDELVALDITAAGAIVPAGSYAVPARCRGLALSPDGTRLFMASSEGLHVLDPASPGAALATVLSDALLLDVETDGEHVAVFELLTNEGEANVRVLRADSLEELAAFPHDEAAPPVGFAFSDVGFLLARQDHGERVELYELGAGGAVLRRSWQVSRGVDSFRPALMAASGSRALLGAFRSLVYLDPTTGAPTTITGPEQGAMEMVRAAGASTLVAHGAGSMHLVDVSDPTAPVWSAGGLVVPSDVQALHLELAGAGHRASFLGIPSILEVLGGSSMSLYWPNPDALPTIAGTAEMATTEGRWRASGSFVYQLAPETPPAVRLRRYPTAGLTQSAGQSLEADLDQILTPTVSPAGFNAYSVSRFDVDARAGALTLLQDDGTSAVLSGFSLGEGRYEHVFSVVLAHDGALFQDTALRDGRSVVAYGDRLVIVDASGTIAAERAVPFVPERILEFGGGLLYLTTNSGVAVLRSDDLSDVAAYETPEQITSMVQVGQVLAFGSPSSLVLASPLCGPQPPPLEPCAPTCEANAARCSDPATLQRCTGDGCAEVAEVEAGSVCVGHGEWERCADSADCPAADNPCLTVTCDGANACSVAYGPDGTPCGAGSCDESGRCLAPEGSSCAGGQTCRGRSCCRSLLVQGGTFDMGRGGVGESDACPVDEICITSDDYVEHSATLGDFYLDEFEVTVGRFRAFVQAYAGPPAVGAGAHPRLADSGWQSSWDGNLPASTEALATALACSEASQTWVDAPTTASESTPINCVTWYEAFSFCAWDGGRLPTEAEWEYAAAGGAQSRPYPWGSAAPDATRATYSVPILAWRGAVVGSHPAGRGRWGHSDLAGSLREWVFDSHLGGWYAGGGNPCYDCAYYTPTSTYRMQRGGTFTSRKEALAAAARDGGTAGERLTINGFRCARDP